MLIGKSRFMVYIFHSLKGKKRTLSDLQIVVANLENISFGCVSAEMKFQLEKE